MMNALRTKRARRVAIILALIACVGAFVAWRMSWRGDPRFVGRWVAVRHGGQPQTFVFDYGAYGSGVVYSDARAAESNDPMLRMTWWIEDQRLFIQNQPREAGLERLLVLLEDGYRLLIGERAQQPARSAQQPARSGRDPILEYVIEEVAPGHWRFVGRNEAADGEVWEITRESEPVE